MKKSINYLKMLMISGVLVAGFNACQKESTNPQGSVISDLNSSQNAAKAEQYSSDMSDIVDDANNSGTANRASNESVFLSACASVTKSSESYPRTITVDFGSTNCKGNDGVWRRGKVIATFSGPYQNQGTVITYRTQDFYVNNDKVDGSKTVTNMGLNSDQHIHFSVSENMTISLANNTGTIMRSANRDREWIAGSGTMAGYDDVYLMRGTSSLTTANGVQYNSLIVNPLRKEMGYRYIVNGSLAVTRMSDNVNYATIDYGYPKGGRDDLALVTFDNGTTKVIHIQ